MSDKIQIKSIFTYSFQLFAKKYRSIISFIWLQLLNPYRHHGISDLHCKDPSQCWGKKLIDVEYLAVLVPCSLWVQGIRSQQSVYYTCQ